MLWRMEFNHHNFATSGRTYAATAEALEKWETRFKLEKVKITEVKEGRVTLDLEGVYLSEGKFININEVVV